VAMCSVCVTRVTRTLSCCLLHGLGAAAYIVVAWSVTDPSS
jgi:hypothetical protein